jgi:gp16 family phage-associated protein
MNKTAPAAVTAIIPFPQTPRSAWTYVRDHGLNISAVARDAGIDRNILVDLLRGKLKGHRGEAHRGAVLLGLKRKPDSRRAAA